MKTDDRTKRERADEAIGPFLPPRARRPGFGPRHMLFAGVAGACALGVGLGLWARPGLAERRGAIPAAQPDAPPADATAHKLRIVLDDRSAPAAAPTEALAAPASPPGPVATPIVAAFAAPAPASVLAAPPAAPPPVVRVQAPSPAPFAPSPSARPAAALAKLTPMMIAALAEMRGVENRLTKPIPPLVRLPQAAPAQLAKAEARPAAPAPKPLAKPAHTVQLAQAAADRATQARAAKLAAATAAQAHRIEVAAAVEAVRAQKAEIQKARFEKAQAERLEKARLAQAEQAEASKLAKAEAHGRAEAKAEARAEAVAEAREEARKQIRLASLARVVRQVLPQHAAKPAPAKPAPVETARNDRKHKARHEAVVEQASLKTHRVPPHAAAPLARSAPPPMIAPQHAAGLMKVSTRCASRDPGEALVCADPSLGAADRQLTRAYQGARAAGVPDAQLQRQQERWLQARSAAAREAPWAVHDVYLARIAELNSLARDAHGDGF
jgi:hypothetical protein